jgi:hypothetical protein
LIILLAKLYAANTKKTAHEVLEESQGYIQAGEHRRQQAARRATAAETPANVGGGMAVFGAPIIGDLPWCFESWLVLPEPELSKHGVVIGGSGSGKTISLLRLAYLAATVYGYRVFYVDAKGDRDTAALFLATMRQAGRNPRMFPREPLSGWRGDGNAQLNRLMSVEVFSEPYYRAVTKRVLSLVCGSPAGAPRNSREFFSRFDDDLRDQTKLSPRDLGGVEMRYRAFFDALGGKLDAGWSWEDTDAAYILLDGLSLKEEAASLGRYLIEDFSHYATTRKKPGRDLLIIDEYSALAQNGADASNLVERLRSYGCAVVLSSQSYAGLGKPEDAERILDAANFLLLHRTAAPERLIARAGNAKNIQEQYQFGGDLDQQIYDRGRVSLLEEYTVHPDQARRLETGEAIMIAHGRYVKARIAAPPVVPAAEIQAARAWIEQPASQQAAPLVRTLPTSSQHLPAQQRPSGTTGPNLPPPAHLSQPLPAQRSASGTTGPMFTLPQRPGSGTTGKHQAAQPNSPQQRPSGTTGPNPPPETI